MDESKPVDMRFYGKLYRPAEGEEFGAIPLGRLELTKDEFDTQINGSVELAEGIDCDLAFFPDPTDAPCTVRFEGGRSFAGRVVWNPDGVSGTLIDMVEIEEVNNG